MRECKIDGCVSVAKARGRMCSKHNKRSYKYGDPLFEPTPSRFTQRPSPGYKALHKRITKARGPAKMQSCIGCLNQASDWAYQCGCRYERVENGKPFSENISLYEPMCRECHKRFDT